MENSHNRFYLMTFYTTTHTMQAYAAIKDNLEVTIMPVPREISASCGLAIKCLGENKAAFKACFDSLEVPSRLFCLDEGCNDPERHVTLIAERQTG